LRDQATAGLIESDNPICTAHSESS
jgi:hypothetical protein